MSPNSTKLGFWSILFLGVNTIIGTGLFLLPGKVLSQAGESLLSLYGTVLLIVAAIVWCCAYCATLFSRNGGPYVYAREAFGPFIGAQIGLMRWFICILAWAALTSGTVTALSSFWPQALQEPYRTLVILSLIGSFTALNLSGIDKVKGLNGVIASAKLIPIAALLLLGFFWINAQSVQVSLQSVQAPFETGQGALIIFYSFAGFESVCMVAGEMKKPTRDIPLAIGSVLMICALAYGAIQLITMSVLSEGLASSITPLSDTATTQLGPWGGIAIAMAMFVSILGVNLGSSFTTPRAASALAEDGLLPPILALNSAQGAPYWSILVTAALTLTVALWGNFAELVAISAISRFASNISTCLAALRFQHIAHGYRGLLLQPWRLAIPLIGLAGIAWLMHNVSWQQLAVGMGGVFIGMPLYLCQGLWNQVDAVSVVSVDQQDCLG